MPGSVFDSNVVLCLTSPDVVKADRAERLLRAGGSISVQGLNEAANVTRRKFLMSRAETRTFLRGVQALVAIQPITVQTHELGLNLAERHKFATYDAMIAAAALIADCDTLWSEDMPHGLLIDGRLRILNPFRSAP